MFYSHNLKRKIRIGKAIAEAVAHRHLEGIKIPVAHINSFFIPLLFHISIVMGKRSRIRIISVIISPGIRKLPAWRHLPRQHICRSAAAFHAGLYDKQKPFDIGKFIQKGKFHQPACIDQKDHMGIFQADGTQNLVFFLRQLIITCPIPPVRSLTGNAAEHIDGCICRSLFRHGPGREIKGRSAVCIKHTARKAVFFHGIGLLPDFLPPAFPGPAIDLIVFRDPCLCGNLVSGFLKPLADSRHCSLIYIAGAGPSFDHMRSACPVKGDLLPRRKGEDLILIF